jgi:hypothetical protein
MNKSKVGNGQICPESWLVTQNAFERQNITPIEKAKRLQAGCVAMAALHKISAEQERKG